MIAHLPARRNSAPLYVKPMVGMPTWFVKLIRYLFRLLGKLSELMLAWSRSLLCRMGSKFPIQDCIVLPNES